MELLKQIFVNGGWVILFYVLCRVLFWIIRKTKTEKDDVILDKYVSQAVNFALKIIPQNSNVNWVKFVGNALGKFSEAYTKEQGDAPDISTIEKAKKLIEEIADNIEFKNVKDVLEQYKNNETVK
ncbi:MAG: hypothetical protein IKO48_07180 [Elusimicrobia bacterium]|nr:hypothetical protein [Elusimicrobiota bacterium]